MAKRVFVNPEKQKDVIRHWSKLKRGHFFLMSGGDSDSAWILEVVSDEPMIQARRYMLDGYELGWASDSNIAKLSLDFLQSYGVLPDPLQNFTLIDCVLPLNATDLQTAISNANKRIEKIKSES